MNILSGACIAYLSGIVGLITTVIILIRYLCKKFMWRIKIKQLENYLEKEKVEAPDGNNGQRTLMHLKRHVGLSEEEILKISSQSNHIQRKIRTNEVGDADILLFEYI